MAVLLDSAVPVNVKKGRSFFTVREPLSCPCVSRYINWLYMAWGGLICSSLLDTSMRLGILIHLMIVSLYLPKNIAIASKVGVILLWKLDETEKGKIGQYFYERTAAPRESKYLHVLDNHRDCWIIGIIYFAYALNYHQSGPKRWFSRMASFPRWDELRNIF